MSVFSLAFYKPAFQWLDTHSQKEDAIYANSSKVQWIRLLPFLTLHLMCLFVFKVGWSPIAVGTAVFLYFARMFAITGFYHRYLAHKTYKTSRWFQFLFAFLGNMSSQRGPLWWASHHRDHHRTSDEAEDIHSPRQHGFWSSHMLWFSKPMNYATKKTGIKDFLRFPELTFLDRYDIIAPMVLGFMVFVFGMALEKYFPGLHTNAFQMLIWGFFISTVALAHGTFTINSLAHVWGKRRFETTDDSRNNFWLAILTMGEGWHNNHHHYANSVRQGFYWWEIDVTYYLLWGLSKLGLVWDLKPVPKRLLTPQTEPVAGIIPTAAPAWTAIATAKVSNPIQPQAVV